MGCGCVPVHCSESKGMKNAGHGLSPGRRYLCHANDSLTEPSGPATSWQAHIPISLNHINLIFHRKLSFLFKYLYISIIILYNHKIIILGTWKKHILYYEHKHDILL